MPDFSQYAPLGPARPVQVQPRQQQAPLDQAELDRRWRQLFGAQADQGLIDLRGQAPPQQQQQAPPQPDLAALQRHGFGVGGTPPQQQQQAPAPLQVQAPPPVQIRTPDMPTPRARPMSPQEMEVRAQRLAQDAHSAGLRGWQQGFYAPTEDPMAMLAQQQGNYARGQDSFLQALAQTSQDDRNRLMRDMQLGELAVKRGAVDVESQKAAAEDATKRAGIASTENVASRQLGSEELRARMAAAAQLQHALITGRASILQAQANQKGTGDAALMSQLFSNPEFMQKILAGGPQAQESIDYLRGVHARAAGAPSGGADLMGGLMGAGDPYAAQLSSMGVGAPQRPIAPVPPPGQVRVNPTGPATPPVPPEDVFSRRATQAAQFVTPDAIGQKLGPSRDLSHVIGTLSSFGHERIAEGDLDNVIQQMLNSGMKPEDLRAGLARDFVQTSRRMGNTGIPGGYTYRAGNDSNLGILIPGRRSPTPLNIHGPNGELVLAGEEARGWMGLPEAMGGTGGQIGNLFGSQNQADAARQQMIQAMLRRYLDKYEPGRRQPATGR